MTEALGVIDIPAPCSVEYILYRVSQHGLLGGGLLRKLAGASGLGNLVLPIYLGERLVIARKRA